MFSYAQVVLFSFGHGMAHHLSSRPSGASVSVSNVTKASKVYFTIKSLPHMSIFIYNDDTLWRFMSAIFYKG